jgi:hemerythrin
MNLNVPESVKKEHEELHRILKKATKEKGLVKETARALAAVLHPHFIKEEEYAMPPLGLLTVLAENRVSSNMKDALGMTNKLKANLKQMLNEHKKIVAELKRLIVVAKKEKKPEYVDFANRLILHAQTEEEVYYPASLLIGKYLKLKLRK